MSSKIEPWLCEKHKIYIQGGYECYRCYRESAVAAPVVERQPLEIADEIELVLSVLKGYKTSMAQTDAIRAMYIIRNAYIAPPELAELQAQLESLGEDVGQLRSELEDTEQEKTELQAAIARLTAENDRSEKHRNSLADEITNQKTTIGSLKAEIERLKGGQGEPVACATCNGSKIVDDGELTRSSGGIPFENGPIKCVKDCPDCASQPASASVPFPGYPPVPQDRKMADFVRLNSAPHCPECGHPDCNGQCYSDDMMGDS